MVQINTISSLIILITSMLAGVLGLIEKTQKIKWKPLTKLFGREEIINKIENLDKKVDKVMERQDELEKINLEKDYHDIREKILNFASDVHNGVGKTRLQYEEYFDKWLPKYDYLVHKLNLTNNWATEEIRYVKTQYTKMDKECKKSFDK